jgi:alanine dehydrogenase
VEIATRGVDAALGDPVLATGVNTLNGRVTNPAVAAALSVDAVTIAAAR